jgi:hypothetical protein
MPTRRQGRKEQTTTSSTKAATTATLSTPGQTTAAGGLRKRKNGTGRIFVHPAVKRIRRTENRKAAVAAEIAGGSTGGRPDLRAKLSAKRADGDLRSKLTNRRRQVVNLTDAVGDLTVDDIGDPAVRIDGDGVVHGTTTTGSQVSASTAADGTWKRKNGNDRPSVHPAVKRIRRTAAKKAAAVAAAVAAAAAAAVAGGTSTDGHCDLRVKLTAQRSNGDLRAKLTTQRQQVVKFIYSMVGLTTDYMGNRMLLIDNDRAVHGIATTESEVSAITASVDPTPPATTSIRPAVEKGACPPTATPAATSGSFDDAPRGSIRGRERLQREKRKDRHSRDCMERRSRQRSRFRHHCRHRDRRPGARRSADAGRVYRKRRSTSRSPRRREMTRSRSWTFSEKSGSSSDSEHWRNDRSPSPYSTRSPGNDGYRESRCKAGNYDRRSCRDHSSADEVRGWEPATRLPALEKRQNVDVVLDLFDAAAKHHRWSDGTVLFHMRNRLKRAAAELTRSAGPKKGCE